MVKNKNSTQEIEDYFQNLSSVVSEGYSKTGIKKHTLEILNYLSDLNLKNKTVLEIGCGVGGLLIEFLKRDFDYVIGFDLSETMIENAKKFVIELGLESKALFLKADFNEFDFNNLGYNPGIIIADRVFCCSPVSFQILEKMLKNKPEYIVITLPRRNILYRKGWRIKLKIRNFRKDIKSQIPAYYYLEKQISKICIKNGYNLTFHSYRYLWETLIYKKET